MNRIAAKTANPPDAARELPSGGKTSRTVLGFGATVLLVLLFDNPIAIYASGPTEFFSFPLQSALLAHSMWFGVLLGVLALCLRLTPGTITQRIILPGIVWVTVVVPTYSKAVVLDYGLMSAFHFDNPNGLIHDWVSLFIEILLLGVLAHLIFSRNEFLSRHYTKFLTFCAVLVVLSTLTNLLQYTSFTANSVGGSDEHHEIADKFGLDLSSTKPNVIVFLFDGFSGGTLPQILSEKPEYRKALKDFTWFKNTVTSNTGTVGALPGILGGNKFTVDAVVESGQNAVRDVMMEAYAALPKMFRPHGFTINFVNPLFQRG